MAQSDTTFGGRLRRNTVVAAISQLSWREQIIYVAFVVVFVCFSILLGDRGFTSPDNLLNILRQTAAITIMAVAMTFVISAAEIDLSVGAVAGLASVTTAVVMQQYGLVPGIAAGLLTGLIVGAVNGGIVAFVGIPSFLVTLGSLSMVFGAAQWVTNTLPVPISNSTFNFAFGGGDLGPVPTLAIWMIVVSVIGHVVLRRTGYGRRVLAVGGNPLAARFSGVDVRLIRFSVLATMGVAAALGGMLYAARLRSGMFGIGQDDNLSVIAAVILGGTSLFGGRGSIVGTVVASLLIGMINNGLILFGLTYAQQLVVRGAIIVLAVALSRRR